MSGVQFTVSEARPGWRPQGNYQVRFYSIACFLASFNCRFNPHRNCHQIATACGSQVTAWDSRAGTSCWQLIHSSSSQVLQQPLLISRIPKFCRETLGLWILTRTNSTCWPLLVMMEWLLFGTPERRKPPCIVVCSTTTGSGV